MCKETGNLQPQPENIFVNVTTSDAYFANLTFDLYNPSGSVFSNTFTNSIRKINWTSLPDSLYYYNVNI